MLQCQHCTCLTVFFPIISLFLPQPALYDTPPQAGTARVQGLHRDESWTDQEIWEQQRRGSCLSEPGVWSHYWHSTQHSQPKAEMSGLFGNQILSCCSFLLSKAEPKQSFFLSVCRSETCGNTWTHQPPLSIRLPGLEPGTGPISLVRTSGTASHKQSCVWQLYPKGLFTETQLSSPMMTPFPLFFWNRRAWSFILTIQLPETMEAHKVPIKSCQKCLINQRTKSSTVGISMQCCLDMPGWKHGESLKKAFLHCLWEPVLYG